MPISHPALVRAEAFCPAYGIHIPILLAPMAGACPASLSVAVANAGGLGACGGLLMQPAAIKAWAAEVRAGSNGGFQLNLWMPDPAPIRDEAAETAVRDFLATWGPAVPPAAADATPPDFAAQCDAMLEVGPSVISSIRGVYPPDFVARMKARGIRWFATVTTVREALEAEAAGADAIVAQGMEAGGHRGTFDAAKAETVMVGLFSLLPAVADAVKVPVVATAASPMRAVPPPWWSARLPSRSAQDFCGPRKRNCHRRGRTRSDAAGQRKHWLRVLSTAALGGASQLPMRGPPRRQTYRPLHRIRCNAL